MSLPLEYWIGFLLAVDFVLVVLLWHSIRSLKHAAGISGAQSVPHETSDRVLSMLEPLVQEANQVALTFERQLEEKNHLIRSLNERLDSRIISLNLLLNRADTYLGHGRGEFASAGDQVYDQQKAILEMYRQGDDPASIAKKLNLPKGEVELVVHLKLHALQMDQTL